MKKILLLSIMFAAGVTHAANLTKLPTPVEQGGMIHVNVVFQDILSGTFIITPDAGTPTLKPITLWSPGDNFLPGDPWYTALSPDEQGLLFNSQYGFLIDSDASDFPPSGNSIGIRMLSATPGLEANFYRSSEPKAFTAIFEPSHDYVLWNGNMWHPVFTANAPGNYEATFEFFLADAAAGSAVDFTTQASPVPGYSTGTVTLYFTAIPEPAVSVLLVAGLGTLLWRGRRR